jgi:CheY-like chemotaxis protein
MGRILIVDDDPLTVEMFVTAISIFGHEGLKAYSGEEALRIVSGQKPDLILLDLMMPGLDGFETLRQLRSMPGLDGLPVLVVTASAERDVEERAAAAGANGCMHKPVDLAALGGWIQRCGVKA